MSDVTLSRRQVLVAAAGVAGALVLADPAITPAGAQLAQTAEPFLLGVASGDPQPDGVILWTRLLRDLYRAEALPDQAIEVGWQVALDERFRRVVRHGQQGPGRNWPTRSTWTWTGWRPAATTSTGSGPLATSARSGGPGPRPAPWARPFAEIRHRELQDLQNGYWPAYWAMAEEDLDVVLHLGDYIYEYDPASRFPDRPRRAGDAGTGPAADPGRLPQPPRPVQDRPRPARGARGPPMDRDLGRPRDREQLRHPHRRNRRHRSRTRPRRSSPRQRAAAYQAYYEHMPIRAHLRPAARTYGYSGGSTSVGWRASTCSTPASTAPISPAVSPATSARPRPARPTSRAPSRGRTRSGG